MSFETLANCLTSSGCPYIACDTNRARRVSEWAFFGESSVKTLKSFFASYRIFLIRSKGAIYDGY